MQLLCARMNIVEYATLRCFERGNEKISGSYGKSISFLYRFIQIYTDKRLKSFNIGGGQFPFLMTLYAGDGISQEEITRGVVVDKGTTAKAIKKLVKEGYIRKEEDPDDKRAYKVYLTEKALQIKPILKEISAHVTDILSSGCTEEEKEATWLTLETMAKNAKTFLIEAANKKET